MATTTARLKPLSHEAAKIFKLCISADRSTFLQGLELASAFDTPIVGLLDEVSVDPASGELLRGKRFTGSDKTQPMLDALLLQQLGLAEEGCAAYALRNTIRALTFQAPVVPSLGAFASLERVKMAFTPDLQCEDLQGLGHLAKLSHIEMSGSSVWPGQERSSLRSLNGLDAPLLASINASTLDLQDIQALAHCRQLQEVQIYGHTKLASIASLEASAPSLLVVNISRCSAIQSLAPLRLASKLKHLDISGLDCIANLDDLKNCQSLEVLEIDWCEGLTTFGHTPLRALKSELPSGNAEWPFLTQADTATPARWPMSLPDQAATSNGAEMVHLYGLKALQSLAGMPYFSPALVDFSIAQAPALTDLSALANAPSLKELKIDRANISDLSALAALPLLETLEISDCPALLDASALGDLEHLVKVTLKSCRKLETMPQAWKSPVKSLTLTGCSALKPLKSLPEGLDPKGIDIPNRRMLPRTKPLKALKADSGSLWKLLSSRDISNIQMGLELSVGLDEKFDAMLEGVSVKNGMLERGRRFTGTGPAQPFLDLALFGLLCLAKEGSAYAGMRGQIRELCINLTSQAPRLEGFTALEVLTIAVQEEVAGDLSSFGPMESLHTLKIGTSRWHGNGGLLSLQGLRAPKLVTVTFERAGLVDVAALTYSPGITHLDLSHNPELVDLSGLLACAPQLTELKLNDCTKLLSLEPLRRAVQLVRLDLSDCESLASLEPLAHCTALSALKLENCAALKSLKGVEDKRIRNDTANEFSLDGCLSLTSLAHLPCLEPEMTEISARHTKALRTLDGLRVLPSVTQLYLTDSGVVDIRAIGSLPNLSSLDLSDCSQLKDATPLAHMAKLESLTLDNAGVCTMPSQWDADLRFISVKGCKALTRLGRLPTALGRLVADACDALTVLDGMQDCQSLLNISVRNCIALSDLGRPPASVQVIDAIGCNALTSLQGLDGCMALTSLSLPLSVTDASALSPLQTIAIALEIPEDDLVCLPAAFIHALGSLQRIDLKIKGTANRWYSKRKVAFDVSTLNQFTNLQTLNFVDFNMDCSMVDLAWLVGIEDLQGLWFTPRGVMAYRLGSSVYDSPRKVAELQKKICAAAAIAPPAHLLAY